MKYPWSNAVVINRSDRVDRLDVFSRSATAVGINYEVFPAIEHEFGAIGCLRSHQAVLKQFQDSGDEMWLICEDDCFFVDEFPAKFLKFFSTVPVGWDALWLGGKHEQEPVHLGQELLLAKDVRLSHSYVISWRAPLGILLRSDPQGYPGYDHTDRIFSKILTDEQFSTYAPLHWLTGQAAGYSDILKRNLPERI